MRVAIVIPLEWQVDPTVSSVDPRLYVSGFGDLDHDAFVVCLEGSRVPPGAQAVVASPSELEDVGYWRRLNVDIALVYTWTVGYREILSATRRAGAFTISLGDSDGLLGVRLHPRATALRAICPSESPLDGARRTWHWVKRYAYLHRVEERAFIANLETADASIVQTDEARSQLVRFLSHHGRPELAARLHAVPRPIADIFCTAPITSKPANRLISVGRWDDPQKDAPLLKRTLAKLSDIDTIIVGNGGDSAFRNLPSGATYVGKQDRERLVDLYSEANVCLVTSRWETFHIAAHEALAMGCTVVAPDLPAMRSIVRNARYGAIARRRGSSSVARTVLEELDCWSRGSRDPREISGFWRAELSPVAVARQVASIAGALTPQPRTATAE